MTNRSSDAELAAELAELHHEWAAMSPSNRFAWVALAVYFGVTLVLNVFLLFNGLGGILIAVVYDLVSFSSLLWVGRRNKARWAAESQRKALTPGWICVSCGGNLVKPALICTRCLAQFRHGRCGFCGVNLTTPGICCQACWTRFQAMSPAEKSSQLSALREWIPQEIARQQAEVRP